MKKKIILLLGLFLVLVVGTLLFSTSSSKNTLYSNIFKVNSSGPRKKYNFDYDWEFALGEGKFNSGSDYKKYCLKTNSEICIDSKTNPGNLYNLVSTYTGVTLADAPYSTDYSTTGNDSWSNVSLPHTYNDVDTFNTFSETGNNRLNGERSMYSGTAWYRKTFNVPAELEGKTIIIEFEAARQASKIYLNGTLLTGMQENGFIPFGYDLSACVDGNGDSCLLYGQDNLITVMVDNSFPYYASGTQSVLPWHDSHWHPNYGGLYRNSYLYVIDDLHLTLPLYSFVEGNGTYIYSSNETGTENSATLHVDAEVENSTDSSQSFVVEAKVYNNENTLVKTITSNTITLESGQKDVVELSDTMSNITYWSDKYPYLYTVECEIKQNNTVIDNNSNTFGFRTFRFTRDYGFYLNENYTELNGWGQKSTMEWAGLGAAYPDWMTDKVIKLMKDANANYLRFGHTSGSPMQVSAADEYGIIVTQPGVDGEGNTGQYSYDTNSLLVRIKAFRDMLIYYRNHPSIVLWEIGNHSSSLTSSVTYDNVMSVGGIDEIYAGNTQSDVFLVGSIMYQLVNYFDYGNRTTAASGGAANAGTYAGTTSMSDRLTTLRSTDSTLSNYVEVSEVTNGVSSTAYNSKPKVEGEYDRIETPRNVWDSLTNNYTPTGLVTDYYLSSIDQAKAQASTQRNMYTISGYTGGANWIFSDSISHARLTSEVARTTGEVDGTMIPKESYYTTQVINSAIPKTYIIGHWNYAANTTKTVYVVAKDVKKVELYVNETKYTGTASSNYLWTFTNVAYEAGTITAKGYDIFGREISSATSSKQSHGTADHLSLTMLNTSTLKADGQDVILVDVEVKDSSGNRCLTYNTPTLSDAITFSLTGDTTAFIYKGGYNSSIQNTIGSYSLYPEAGIIRIAIKTTKNPGTIYLHAQSTQGLVATPLQITSEAISNQVGTFTGVNTNVYSPSYSLNSLTDPGYGDGVMFGRSVAFEPYFSSILIGSLEYNGTFYEKNTISEAFSAGTKIYSDSNVTFTNVPYRYLNAEYLLLPSVDNESTNASLMTFNIKRDIDVFVLRDPSITLPSWMSDYTLVQGETVVGGNGVEYSIYKKAFACANNVCPTVTIGGNTDVASDATNKANQVIFFKETSKVNGESPIFFNENFDNFDILSLMYGWHASAETELDSIDFTADTETFASEPTHGEVIHLYDDDTIRLGYMQVEFARLTTKFEISFDAYVDSTTYGSSNTWLRVFLSSASMNALNDKGALAVEGYLNDSGGGITYNVRTVLGSNVVHTAVTGKSQLNWNRYKFTVDPIRKKYTVSVNGGYESSEFPFVNDVSSVNTIIFGTGESTKSNYYIDNVVINPLVDESIESITISKTSPAYSHLLQEFSNDVDTYYAANADAEATITVVPTSFCQSYTTTYVTDHWEIAVQDVQGNSKTIKIYDALTHPLLEGWTLHTPTGTEIKVDTFGGEDVIRLTDNAGSTAYGGSGQFAYMERALPIVTDGYTVSYKIYVPTNSYENKYFRSFITNKELGTTGYAEAIKYQNDKSSGRLSSYYYSTKSVKTYFEDTATLDEWHEVKITSYVNQSSVKVYDIYIDGNLMVGNKSYLSTVTDPYIHIGTGGNATNDFYIKDYSFMNSLENPVTGLSYDSVLLDDFDPEVTTYDIYTESPLISNTEASMTVTNQGNSSSINIVRNVVEQTVTYNVEDLNGTLYTYTLNVHNIANETVTLEEFTAYVEEQRQFANQKLALEVVPYTQSTWDNFISNLESSEALLQNQTITNSQLTNAYYNLRLSIIHLVTMVNIDYASAIMQLVYVTPDINAFFTSNGAKPIKKVLENGLPVYASNSTITFRSVPLKYQNADYVYYPSTNQYAESEFSFKTKRNVSVMVFRDINAGPVADENYVYTGDIVTAIDETDPLNVKTIVYKVYKRNYSKNDIIHISSKSIVNNRITQNGDIYYNNIVAFKDQDDVIDNKFLTDSFTKYDSIDDINQAWGLYTYDVSGVNDNVQTLDTFEGKKAVNLLSPAGGSGTAGSYMQMFRRFAKQYGKFTMKLSVFAIDNISLYDNQWLRTWVSSLSPAEDDETSLTDGWSYKKDSVSAYANSTIDTDSLLVENYFGYAGATNTPTSSSKFGLNYRDATHPSNTMLKQFDRGLWSELFTYHIDVNAKNYTVDYGSQVSNTLYNFRHDNLDYAHYYIIGTRKTGKSSIWFTDFEVQPVEEELIDNIYIVDSDSTNPIGLDNNTRKNYYTSATKDYLYTSNDLSNLTISVDEGINARVDASNSTGYDITVDATTNDYVSVVADSDTVASPLDHRIYYETDCENDKRNLIYQIERGLDLSEEDYLNQGWGTFQSELTNSVNMIKNETETCLNISTQATELEEAIDALVPVGNSNYFYRGHLKYGKNLDTETAQAELFINNDSSFELTATFSSSFQNGYPYSQIQHNRVMVFSSAIPEGTVLTLLDESTSNYQYYTYTVPAGGLTECSLSNFVRLGSTDATNTYGYPVYYDSNLKEVVESFKILVDFGGSVTKLANGIYTVKLINRVSDITVGMSDLYFNISDDFGTQIVDAAASSEIYKLDEPIYINVNVDEEDAIVNNNSIVNTKKFNERVGLRITLYDDDVQESFPNNTKVTFNNNTCYVFNNECNIALGDISQVITGNLEIDFGYGNNLSLGTHTLKLEFTTSPSGKYGTVIDTKLVDITLINKSSYGFKVDLDASSVNVLKASEMSVVQYNFTVSGVPDDYNILVSMDKNVNGVYENVEMNSKTLSDLVLVEGTNKYTLGNARNIETTFRNLDVGSYRISFDLYYGNNYISTLSKYLIVK